MSGPDKASSPTILDPAQLRFLEDLFRIERRFFLSGGAALGGYYLHHRRSLDLDLFTLEDGALTDLSQTLASLSDTSGWAFDERRKSPTFRRWVAREPSGGQISVDFVRDVDFQAETRKAEFGLVRVDTLPDLCANKICTILERIEPRDYIDLYFLERAGFRVEDHIELAQKKDSAVECEILGKLLRDARVAAIPATMVAKVNIDDLHRFLSTLASRLARKAFPGNAP